MTGAEQRTSQILIVDDLPENLRILRRMLEAEGHRISAAPSGEIALRIAPTALPDLILLDVMMPGVDGFETCRRLKEDPLLRHVPVVFVTAKGDLADLVEGFRVGGVDYITKPFKQEEVVARISTHLQNHLLRKQREQLIFELEELNRALRESKERFRGLSAATFEGVLLHEKGRIIDANDAATRMFGYSREELIGKSSFDLVIPESRPTVAEKIDSGSEQVYEVEHLRKDGTTLPVEVQAKNTRFYGRDVRVVALRDITERRQAENRLRRAKEEAEAANQAKNELLANLRLSISPPLSSLLEHVEKLAALKLAAQVPSAEEHLSAISANASILAEILAGIRESGE